MPAEHLTGSLSDALARCADLINDIGREVCADQEDDVMHVSVRHEPMAPFFDKWHVEGLPFGAVLHRFTDTDHGDPHDHPWKFRSTILHGGYVEEVYARDGSFALVERRPGDSFEIAADHVHRIVRLLDGECWTLIQPGADAGRKSGFWRFENGRALRRAWDEAGFREVAA